MATPSPSHTPAHTNRLIYSTSPYLLQHAHNPVEWYPWGAEAIETARRLDKPIFLSVGYSTCYWCHVMERQSFENEAIAAEMNDKFVCIKVDREERPDVDQLYMTAVQVLTRQGGWPMSVFLTPELKPFFGGTYFPPTDGHGRPGFPRVLNSISATYVASSGDKFKTLTNESASPFGTFEYGAAIGGAWLGGSSPTSGIAVGQSRTFLFELSGNSETTAGLTAASFLTNNLPGGTVYPLAVRFRGFANGGSDKVIGGEPTPPPPTQVVPVPAAVWGGMVLLGFLGAGKRVRSRKAEAENG